MNILQINTMSNKGGAPKVGYMLKEEFKKLGYDSKMIVGRRKFRSTIDPDIKELKPNRFLSAINYRLGLNDLIFPTYRTYVKDDFFKSADVVNFHNIHGGYFNILALPKLSKLKPSVWTLHDPWLVHNNEITPEYNKIFSGVGPIFKIIRDRAVEKSRVTFVVPSNWLGEKIIQRFPAKEVHLIRHGIDTTIFTKTDKKETRMRLNLPLDKKIIMFSANGGKNLDNKGWSYTKEIIDRFKNDKNIIFLCIGGVAADNDSSSENIKYIGYISDERVLAQYYSVADVFLFPTLAESFGLVIIESMACGLPVVSFRIGGVPELIRHKKTGYIANYKDTEDLFRGVEYILNLNQAELEEMSRVSIQIARTEYDLKRMVKDYLNLYEKIS